MIFTFWVNLFHFYQTIMSSASDPIEESKDSGNQKQSFKLYWMIYSRACEICEGCGEQGQISLDAQHKKLEDFVTQNPEL